MRVQSKSSFIYMFRNFGQLFFVTLPVSVLLAFCCNPRLETDLFVTLVTGQLTSDNFFDLFSNAFTVLRFGSLWWVVLLAVILLAFTMCLMVVKIDRHMRMGKMPTLPLKRSVGIFPIMLLYIVGCIVIYEAFMLIIVGVVYMLRFLPSVAAVVGIGFGLTLLTRAFLTYIFCLLIVTFPLKYSENYRVNVAMSYSARLMTAKRGKLIMMSVVYPLARYAVLAIAYLVRPLDVVIYALAVFFALTFVPCFAFKQYYDDVGGERRDVSQIMFG